MSCPKCKFYNSIKAVECARCGVELPKAQDKISSAMKIITKDSSSSKPAKPNNFNDIAKALEKHVKREIELSKSEIRIKGMSNPFDSKMNCKTIENEVPETIKLNPIESNLLKNINILDDVEAPQIPLETKDEPKVEFKLSVEEMQLSKEAPKSNETKTEEVSLNPIIGFGLATNEINASQVGTSEKTEIVTEQNISSESSLNTIENAAVKSEADDDLLSQLNLDITDESANDLLNELKIEDNKLENQSSIAGNLDLLNSINLNPIETADDLLSELSLNTPETKTEIANNDIDDLASLLETSDNSLIKQDTFDNLLNELNLNLDEQNPNILESELSKADKLETGNSLSIKEEDYNDSGNLDSLINQTLKELETADNLLDELSLSSTEPKIANNVNDIIGSIDKINDDISNLIAATNNIQEIKLEPKKEKSEIELIYEKELGRELEAGELEMLLGIEEKKASSSSLDALIESTTGIQTINLANISEDECLEEEVVENKNCYVLNEEDTDLNSLLKELEEGLENN